MTKARSSIAAVACTFVLAGAACAQEASKAMPSASSRFPELPLRRDDPNGPGNGLLAWLGVALLAALGGAAYWRRRAEFASTRNPGISASAARALTAHASLHVLEWEGERLLVACTSQNVIVVSRRPLATQQPVGEGSER